MSLTDNDLKKIGSVVDEKLESFAVLVKQGFDNNDMRFEQIDKRFEQVDKRFDQIDKRFKKTDDKIDSLKYDMIDGFRRNKEEFVKVHIRIDELEKRVIDDIDFLTKETVRINSKVNLTSSKVNKLELFVASSC